MFYVAVVLAAAHAFGLWAVGEGGNASAQQSIGPSSPLRDPSVAAPPPCEAQWQQSSATAPWLPLLYHSLQGIVATDTFPHSSNSSRSVRLGRTGTVASGHHCPSSTAPLAGQAAAVLQLLSELTNATKAVLQVEVGSVAPAAPLTEPQTTITLRQEPKRRLSDSSPGSQVQSSEYPLPHGVHYDNNGISYSQVEGLSFIQVKLRCVKYCS